MKTDELTTTAQTLVAPGKGILAADESTPTMTKRLEAVAVESTEENRRACREMLFTAAGLSECISGVILFDETIRQKTGAGVPFPELLQSQGMLTGIKVDRGARPLAGFPGERITEGLDGLRERFAEYAELGARFSKWRAVIRITDGTPTRGCLRANAHALARFAALSQECGLVSIVEPEVLMDGDHTLERCAEVTESMQRLVFRELMSQRVTLEQMILKPNMVTPGKDCPRQNSISEDMEAERMAA
jgi:fructose-bisphosphate aldolase, class I